MPITALIVIVPIPVPLLVIVPVLLMEVVDKVAPPVLLVAKVKFPVPEIPPVRVTVVVEGAMVKLVFKETAPLNTALLLDVVIVFVPLLPETTEIGLDIVTAPVPLRVAFEEPLVSPSVIVPPLPNAAAEPPPKVPPLICTPVVKVFVADKVNGAVVLFCITPVTLVPMTEVIVFVPVVELLLVIVPVLFTAVVVNDVRAVVPVLLIVRFPVPLTPPVNVSVRVVQEATVSALFKVMAPLKIGLPLELQLIVAIPLLPDATVIALVCVIAPPLVCRTAFDEPVVSPSVTDPAPNEAAALPAKVPAFTVSPELKVLVAFSDHVPVPVFITEPLEITFPATLAAFEPSKVKVKVAKAMVPLKVKLPLLDTTVALLPKVSAPIIVEAVLEESVIAPILPLPVPFIVIASVAEEVRPNPLVSKVPPLETVVPAAVVPKGPDVDNVEDTPSLKVPSVIDVAEA